MENNAVKTGEVTHTSLQPNPAPTPTLWAGFGWRFLGGAECLCSYEGGWQRGYHPQGTSRLAEGEQLAPECPVVSPKKLPNKLQTVNKLPSLSCG